MYYRISKNEKNLFFWKKNRPGVGSDLKQVSYYFIMIHFKGKIQNPVVYEKHF